MKKITDLYSLTMKVDVVSFKDTYITIFEEVSKKFKMPGVRPIQVILEGIVGFCQINILRHPDVPAYQMRDFVLRLSDDFCKQFKMGSVVINKKSVAIDDERVPSSMKIDMDNVKSIIKKASEDKLFDEKYRKEREQQAKIDTDEEMEKMADLYASRRMKTASITLVKKDSKAMVKSDDVPDEEKASEESDTILDIMYSIEKEGQLVLLI